MNNTHTKINRRTVMAEANALVKTAKMDRSTAMKQGYKIARLYALFAAGAMATITFIKADGTERPALALPARTGAYLCNGNGHATPQKNILYFDVEKNEFRSFAKARLVTVA